jgi:hypothetical protein
MIIRSMFVQLTPLFCVCIDGRVFTLSFLGEESNKRFGDHGNGTPPTVGADHNGDARVPSMVKNKLPSTTDIKDRRN